MNKKIILVFALALFLLSGCQKTEKPTAIAVLSLEEKDTGKIVYLDKDYKEIKNIDCQFPYLHYYQDGNLYISDDETTYHVYQIEKGKEVKTVKNIVGELLDFQSENQYLYYLGGGVCYYKDGNVYSLQMIPYAYIWFNNHYYVVDEKHYVNVFDEKDFTLTASFYSPAVNFARFIVIDNTLYLVTDNGVCKIAGDKIELTYLYSERFDDLLSCRGKRISVYVGEEIAVYRLAFNDYAMEMELELDERYYKEYDLDKLFKEYLDAGYEFVSIIEVSDYD